jgi:hypothetical protein
MLFAGAKHQWRPSSRCGGKIADLWLKTVVLVGWLKWVPLR